MKRIMLVGPSRSGKTSLIQRLNGEALCDQKTQMIMWYDDAIDTPGEYLENRHLYSALINSACEADVIGLVQNVDTDQSWFAPMFAQVFNKPVIGIVSKYDVVDATPITVNPISSLGNVRLNTLQNKHITWAAECLIQAGAEPIFVTSSLNGDGIAELASYLFQ